MYSGRLENFEQEISNTEIILKRMENDCDLEKPSYVEFYPLKNHDLIKDIISVKEIKANLEFMRRRVSDYLGQNIIEEFAYKSRLLKKFTNIFQRYRKFLRTNCRNIKMLSLINDNILNLIIERR